MTYHRRQNGSDWVAGLSVFTDDFREFPRDSFPKRNYSQSTVGDFVQTTWKVSHRLQTKAGLRSDYVAGYGWLLLPRVSALFTLADGITSRLGGGLGYKPPTIFTEETERIQLRHIGPIGRDSNRLERS